MTNIRSNKHQERQDIINTEREKKREREKERGRDILTSLVNDVSHLLAGLQSRMIDVSRTIHSSSMCMCKSAINYFLSRR